MNTTAIVNRNCISSTFGGGGIPLIHPLNEDDPDIRVQSCAEDANLPHNIIWRDKVTLS